MAQLPFEFVACALRGFALGNQRSQGLRLPTQFHQAHGLARDCGDFASACLSGYTFFRRTTSPRTRAGA